jgi:hypothetical protein
MSKNMRGFPVDVVSRCSYTHTHIHIHTLFVENKGVEPLTPCVQGRCSDQLS